MKHPNIAYTKSYHKLSPDQVEKQIVKCEYGLDIQNSRQTACYLLLSDCLS